MLRVVGGIGQSDSILRITDVVAAGAILTPVWWQKAHSWSVVSADVLQFMGIAWILLQAVVLIYKTWIRK